MLFAQAKGSDYDSSAPEAEKIRDLNQLYGLKKWGWVIYRCTYGDDDAWARFIDRLNRHIDATLQDFYKSPDLVASYDWTVQEDPVGLEGATKDEVRRRFRQLCEPLVSAETPADVEDFKQQALMCENPRFNYCIHVDAEALQSCLQRASNYCEGPLSGHVNIVRADKDWDLPDFDRFDGEKYEAEKQKQHADDGPGEGAEEDQDDYDEGEPEIEGSRLSDVGWMKFDVRFLVPELYATLIKSYSWDRIYSRPPDVAEV